MDPIVVLATQVLKNSLMFGVICKVSFGPTAKLQSFIHQVKISSHPQRGTGSAPGAVETGIVWAPLLILALLSNSLCFFRLLWGQGWGPRYQEAEMREVKKARRSYGVRVVCTTQMSSVVADVQMLVLSPMRASSLHSLLPVMELASWVPWRGPCLSQLTPQALTSSHLSYSDILYYGHFVPQRGSLGWRPLNQSFFFSFSSRQLQVTSLFRLSRHESCTSH